MQYASSTSLRPFSRFFAAALQFKKTNPGGLRENVLRHTFSLHPGFGYARIKILMSVIL